MGEKNLGSRDDWSTAAAVLRTQRYFAIKGSAIQDCEDIIRDSALSSLFLTFFFSLSDSFFFFWPSGRVWRVAGPRVRNG